MTKVVVSRLPEGRFLVEQGDRASICRSFDIMVRELGKVYDVTVGVMTHAVNPPVSFGGNMAEKEMNA